jgi:hypothetical protein
MNHILLTADQGDGVGDKDEDYFRKDGVSCAKSAVDGIVEFIVVVRRDEARGNEISGCSCEAGSQDDFRKDEHGNCDDEAGVGAEVSQEWNLNIVAECLVPDRREDEQYEPCDKKGQRCPAYDSRSALANETKAALDAVERASLHQKKRTILRSLETFDHVGSS